jgi:hypothetical protein
MRIPVDLDENGIGFFFSCLSASREETRKRKEVRSYITSAELLPKRRPAAFASLSLHELAAVLES